MFKHALTQDVAYATLVTSARRALHRRVAEALPHVFPGRGQELAPRLAHHFFEAEAWPEAVTHSRGAAELARRSFANREAVAGYGRALVAARRAEAPAATHIEILEARADAHAALGDFDAARADLEAAGSLAEDSGDPIAQARTLGALGALWGGHRDYQRGLEFTERAVSLLEGAGDRRALAEARARLGIILLNLVRMRDSRRELEAARALFRQTGDELGDARTMEMLAMSAWLSGDGEAALALAEQATDRLHALGDRAAEVSALLTFAAVGACQRGWPAAQPIHARAMRAALDTHAPAIEAYARILTADFATYFGRFGLAWREASAGLEIARDIGHLEWTAYGLGVVGRIHEVAGDADTARRLHGEMLDTARRLGTTFWMAGALASLGADLLRADDRDGARRALEDALHLAGEAVEAAMHAFPNLGDLELRDGRPQAALDVVRRFRATGATFSMITLDIRRVEAQALTHLGALDQATEILTQVKREALALDVLPVLWRTSLALATIHERCGRSREATDEARNARALLEHAAKELPEPLRTSFVATQHRNARNTAGDFDHPGAADHS